ncbi:mitochondrial protein C2orf69 homolog [Gadus chalcogrammus]|uniref:mitochondrial protein C2orf69 homolog n=1 Tax=Gadus chalcogrammus TaxID=1042646 RepID=UPI0024C4E0D5|nr:mitochondrial protein C2orf69 homolog [Gadus chalcogrammus]
MSTRVAQSSCDPAGMGQPEAPGLGSGAPGLGSGAPGLGSGAPGLGSGASGLGPQGVPDLGSGCPERPQLLVAVPGCDPSRVNDLLVLRPSEWYRCRGSTAELDRSSNDHVVFFHGDIQNLQEEMSVQPEGAKWLSWSLEQVGLSLGRRFPGRTVWVVRASSMYLHMFSSYHNFVEGNLFGAPEHRPYAPDSGAFQHLRGLLSHGMQRAGLPHPLPPPGSGSNVPPGFSLTLVGFSKGCVVLNQMVYEMAGARADPRMAPFVESVSDIYWLDGGHPGGGGTWVTDKAALRELASSGAELHAHVTPYEVRDPMRAWVGREHDAFVKTLVELGARLTHQVHFEDEPPSIENHFRVIQEF